MTKSTSYDSGQSLLEALTKGELIEDAFIGMVKASEVEDHIAFAPGSCEEGWIDVPADLVARADIVDQALCKDHSHPLVRLQLTLDDSEPVHKMLHQLLARSPRQRASTRPSPPPLPTGPVSRSTRPLAGRTFGQEDGYWSTCVTVCAGNQMWCVCWASDGESWSYPCGSCGGFWPGSGPFPGVLA